MYNPDDVMDEPCYTGSGNPKDFRKVAVLNMFLLKQEHIQHLEAFVVDKNPKVRVESHIYVPVLKEVRTVHDSVKSIYVASTSPKNDWLLYEVANPGLAYNCAKGLSKIFPEMYCWGNSLATTIRRQALSIADIDKLSSLENYYYNTLSKWKKKSNELELNKLAPWETKLTELELEPLKKRMDLIKKNANVLIQPHQFDWGLEVLKEFETLYSAKLDASVIVSNVSKFLTEIQSSEAQRPVKIGTGGTKKRKTHKKRKSKRPKSKHNKSKTSKNRTKKRKTPK
jgi:hypothetical protein